MKKNQIIHLSPIKGQYRAALAISFDYETSAIYGNTTTFSGKIKGPLLNITNKLGLFHTDLSFYYGLGYSMRFGSYNIIEILKRYNLHATWFATGHALLKGNKNGDAFRINQILDYAKPEAGFTSIVSWRRKFPTFFYEPKGDFITHPYWYFGDISEELRNLGEDIQCHTFSHPYLSLEPPENVKIDIEDWQNVAEKYGFKRASILSFPFCGDAHRYYPDLNLNTMIGRDIPQKRFEIVPLKLEIIDILKKNGIELFTRCGSKIGEGYTIAPYNKGDCYYIPDFEYSYLLLNKKLLDRMIEETIKDCGAINIWLHPSNVFSKVEKENFEGFIRYLKEINRKGPLWLTTLSDIWEHFKKVKSCALIIEPQGRALKITIKNNNPVAVEEIGIILDLPNHKILKFDNNLTEYENKILIKKIESKGYYTFFLEVKNGHPF